MAALRRLLAWLSGQRSLAAALRLLRRTRQQMRHLERLITQQQSDYDAKCRECDALESRIEAMRAEVDGVAAAHEKLIELNRKELALHRLDRIRFEEGVRGPRGEEEE